MTLTEYMILPDVPDRPFYEAVLRGIGADPTPNTLATLYAWRQAEGGSATYNPFNTTQSAEGATNYNSVGVKNYLTPQVGVAATVQTLLHSRYAHVRIRLRWNQPPENVATAIIDSPWGTGSLLNDVLAMYRRGKIVVNPIATVPGAPPISSLTPKVKLPALRTDEGKIQAVWWVVGGVTFLGLMGAGFYAYRRGKMHR